MADIQRIDIKEFRELGFLQEANRLFFHPLGLSMEVVQEDDGTERLGGVWDYREDPEGMVFGDDMISPSKADHIEELKESKRAVREKLLGNITQPIVPNKKEE